MNFAVCSRNSLLLAEPRPEVRPSHTCPDSRGGTSSEGGGRGTSGHFSVRPGGGGEGGTTSASSRNCLGLPRVDMRRRGGGGGVKGKSFTINENK